MTDRDPHASRAHPPHGPAPRWTRRPHPTSLRYAAAALLAAVLAAAGVLTAGPAAADGPGSGPPWVATLGDSYISGEAGRWAGNTNGSPSAVDALGPTAYYDNPTRSAELIRGCHRSASAEAFVGGIPGVNLACSGARTSTHTATDGAFKPGLDFADLGGGRVGQARLLEDFARTHRVGMVVVSIGGNDFGFADIVQRCVTNWLTSPSWWPNYCHDDSSVRAYFTAAHVAAVQARVVTALGNVRTAMRNAGYDDGSWGLLVQTYPSPIPRGTGFRYPQSGYTRQSVGGCGFWNRDADWANDSALATINATVRAAVAQQGAALLELQSSFAGRRLCESGVGLLEEKGLTSWRQAGAVDRTEWVSQIRTVSTIVGPYQLQEALHPSYWGQMATRSCVRQAWNDGAVRGGTCVRSGSGLTALGEPQMTLR